MTDNVNEPGGTPTLRLVVAWGFVGIPLLWGVAQVVQRSLALFK